LAVSESTVALAYKFNMSPVLAFRSAAAGDCLAGPPALTTSTLGQQASATSPSVALGPPNGTTLWGAWVESVDGAAVVRVGH